MSDILDSKKTLDDDLRPSQPGEDITPEHDAYIREKIRAALQARKQHGTKDYKTLDDITAKYGL